MIPVLFVAVAVMWFGEPVVLGGAQAAAAAPVLMPALAVADAPKFELPKVAPETAPKAKRGKSKGKAKAKAARVKPVKFEPLAWTPLEPIKVPRFEPLVVPKIEPLWLPEIPRIEPRMFVPLAVSDRTPAPASTRGRDSTGRAPCTIGDGYQTVRFSDGSVYSGTFKGCEPQPGPAEYRQGTVEIRGVAEPLSNAMVRLRSETAEVTIRLEIVTR